jgi:hypothetical protein
MSAILQKRSCFVGNVGAWTVKCALKEKQYACVRRSLGKEEANGNNVYA